MNFASDNTAGVAPKILDAVARANHGFALGYGNDELTKRVERRFAELFERDGAVFLVPTGTAANALALAQLAPPWGAVLCHAESHIVTDECGAPEFFGGGLKLIELAGEGCKLVPATLQAALERFPGHRPHEVVPSALSLTQATEAGTIYRPDEIRALAEIAHAHGLGVHMDGARFANALVRLGATPAEATWKAGIDALSFGATKGGALAAEAIIFFDPQRATAMPERRKRGGHLLSKHRFVAAQLEAFLADDYGLELARHANRLADRLASRLSAAGVPPVWPVEANLLFVVLPRVADARLKTAGAAYYVRQSDSLPPGMVVRPDHMLVRLVTSFATSESEVDRFAELVCTASA
jgi:threonine aldolase